MLDRLLRLARIRIDDCWTEEPPRVQRGISEKLVHSPVEPISASFNRVVLNSLPLVDCRVAACLHLELVHCVDRDRGPHKTRVAVAAGAHERQTVNVNSRCSASAT